MNLIRNTIWICVLLFAAAGGRRRIAPAGF